MIQWYHLFEFIAHQCGTKIFPPSWILMEYCFMDFKCFTLFSRAFLHVALDLLFAFVLWLYYFHHLTHINILTVNFLKDCQKDCVSQWLLEFRSIALFLFNCILSLNVHACNS